MFAALCFIQNRERKKLGISPLLLIGTGLCYLLYYISWLAYTYSLREVANFRVLYHSKEAFTLQQYVLTDIDIVRVGLVAVDNLK